MPTQTRLSRRAARVPASPIRRLAPFAARARAAGKSVLHLNIGQPDIEAPREILDRLRTFDEGNVAYGPSQGLPEFVEVVRGYHRSLGYELSEEQIFVTTGGSEALLFSMAAVADPGDEVLVFEPFYTNYSGFSELIGVRTVPVTTHAADGYRLPSREAIEAKLTERTRAIVFCSPNNPTGTVYDADELARVAAICRERGLFLIADEVYREFVYDGGEHHSALALDGMDEQVIVTDSLSKRVSLCGARVGWIVCKNAEVMRAILHMGQARLCPPTLGQHIAVGLGSVGDDYVREVLDEYRRRRDCVYAALSEMPGVTLERPEGAFYVFAKLPIDDSQRFAEFLLGEFDIDGECVMVAPGDGFYATEGLGRDEIRIAYVLDVERLGRAMKIVAAALEAYPGRTR